MQLRQENDDGLWDDGASKSDWLVPNSHLSITGTDLGVDDDFLLNTGDIMEGTLIIDETSTEALLVRKDGDAGDVLIVDTTNERVSVGATLAARLSVIGITDEVQTIIRANATQTNNLMEFQNTAGALSGVVYAAGANEQNAHLVLGNAAAVDVAVIPYITLFAKEIYNDSTHNLVGASFTVSNTTDVNTTKEQVGGKFSVVIQSGSSADYVCDRSPEN